MKAEGLSDAAISAFKRNYDALVSGETVCQPAKSSLSLSTRRRRLHHHQSHANPAHQPQRQLATPPSPSSPRFPVPFPPPPAMNDVTPLSPPRDPSPLLTPQGVLPENTITPVESLPRLDDLRGKDRGDVQALLKATAVLKLNGEIRCR